MDFRCSALDCDDRPTHSQGGGANAPRSQAEFPHVNRMVSLTNASVIQSLLFVVVLDFRSWETSSGDLSVIIDADDQLLRSNSPLAMLQVDAGRQVSASFAVCTQHKVCPVIGKGNKKAGALVVCIDGWTNVSRTYARPPSESGIPFENMTSQVMTISSVDDEEKCQVWTLKNEREQCLLRETLQTAPQPTTHVHLRSICRVPSRLVSTAPFCF